MESTVENACASSAAGTCDNCHQSGEPESAREDDDQDSCGINEGMSQSRLWTFEEIHAESDEGRNDHSPDNVRG